MHGIISFKRVIAYCVTHTGNFISLVGCAVNLNTISIYEGSDIFNTVITKQDAVTEVFLCFLPSVRRFSS